MHLRQLQIHYSLVPFIGKPLDAEKRVGDHRRIYDTIIAKKIEVLPTVEIAVMQDLMLYAMNKLHFEEAQVLLEACSHRLAPLHQSQLDLQVSLLEKRAWLFGVWSEYAEEQKNTQIARAYREEAMTIYRQCNTLLLTEAPLSTLKNSTLKRRLARTLNHLGYYLNRDGQFKEALQVIEQSIALKEQGYVQVGSLAASYGEKAESLAGLGRFREALQFDNKAFVEIHQWAAIGHTPSQQEIWIYRVNRGRLYLRPGRIDEAEQLLREALTHIHPRRRMYRMFAKDALEEIEQWHRQTTSPQHQLDWRWIERYRELDAYDAYWWWHMLVPSPGKKRNSGNRICEWSRYPSTDLSLALSLFRSASSPLSLA